MQRSKKRISDLAEKLEDIDITDMEAIDDNFSAMQRVVFNSFILIETLSSLAGRVDDDMGFCDESECANIAQEFTEIYGIETGHIDSEGDLYYAYCIYDLSHYLYDYAEANPIQDIRHDAEIGLEFYR